MDEKVLFHRISYEFGKYNVLVKRYFSFLERIVPKGQKVLCEEVQVD